VSAQTDHELMLRVREGQLRCLGVLFERHHRRLFNFFLRLTGNRTNSEDLTQEVFFRILRSRATYRDEGEFTAWMYRVARNVSTDHMRKAAREVVSEEEVERHIDRLPAGGPATPPSPLDELDRERSVRLLRAALFRLPVEMREVLVLSRYELLKYAQIAELLDCSVGAVKLRVHRAVKRLRQVYLTLAEEAAP
jgi:RNA polymerase sigma-70 factor, ECF subfamily